MKYLLTAVAALIAAVVLGYYIELDPGFVVIGYGGKVYRAGFVPFVVLVFVVFFLVYVAAKSVYQLLTLRSRWRRWTGEYRRRRSQKSLSNGMLALAEGDFARAEKLLSRGADRDLEPAVHYLGAAQAAQAQNAADRRDVYLSLAHDAMPEAEPAIGIQRAELQLNDSQFEQAYETLAQLADRYPDNQRVLSLQHRLFESTGDWHALMRLLPALKRHRVYDAERLGMVEIEVARAVLAGSGSSYDELHDSWNRLPKTVRGKAASVALYARQLVKLGYDEEAEALIRKTLNRHWDQELIRQYGFVQLQNVSLQLDRAEGWLKTRTDDPDLLSTLARLCIRLELWGKARSYLETVLDIEPSPIAYRLLGEVFARLGDDAAARRCQRDGLVLATEPPPTTSPAVVS